MSRLPAGLGESRPVEIFVIERGKTKRVYDRKTLEDTLQRTNGASLETFVQENPDHVQVHTVYLVTPRLYEQDVQIRNLQLTKDKDGDYFLNPNLYAGAFIQVLVSDWTFPYDPNMRGFSRMPPGLAGPVFAILAEASRDGEEVDESFLALFESKPNPSLPEQPTPGG